VIPYIPDGMFQQCHHLAVLLVELYAIHLQLAYVLFLIQYTLPIAVHSMSMVLLILRQLHAIVLHRTYIQS